MAMPNDKHVCNGTGFQGLALCRTLSLSRFFPLSISLSISFSHSFFLSFFLCFFRSFLLSLSPLFVSSLALSHDLSLFHSRSFSLAFSLSLSLPFSWGFSLALVLSFLPVFQWRTWRITPVVRVQLLLLKYHFSHPLLRLRKYYFSTSTSQPLNLLDIYYRPAIRVSFAFLASCSSTLS